MDGTTSFGNLTRSMERFSGEFEKAKAEVATSETLIASAEYELEQLKQAFAGARLDAEALPHTPAPDATPADFAEKLRKPENWDDADWQAVMGLRR